MSSSGTRRADEAAVAEQIRSIASAICLSNNISLSHTAAMALGRESLFLGQFQTVAREIFKDKLVPSGYALKKKSVKEKRIDNLLLSDTHFGANLDVREVGHSYSHVEESRRLAKICVDTVEYKTRYRDESTLFVHLAGDIIQGQLVDPRDGNPLAQQCAAAIRLLAQAISFFSKHFPKVEVFTTTGNHGRNTARHRERATCQKWDSIEQIIYVALQEAARPLKNVTVHLEYQPYYTYAAFDKYGFVTHGDTVINPGYPGKSIDVLNVRKQINEINASLKGDKRYSLFAVGHVHVGSMTYLPGSVFISNGCLIPPDAYANSIGIFDSECGQYLWESVPEYIVGDSRLLRVNEETDKDRSLDKVIQPFSGL